MSRVLDPAVGSGHFLLGCYDLLEQAWLRVGTEPPLAAPEILGSLYGLDIDPRAAQVAQAVLLLRARQAAPVSALAPPTIATARGLPSDKIIREHAIEGLGPSASELARNIADALDQASELGSLLKVELRLQEGAAAQVARSQLRLGDRAETTTEELEEEILAALRSAAAQADAAPPVRMFAADAADAIRFVEVCQQRYHTVLMNPPFGDPISSTQGYLRSAYGKSAADLYAAFVARGIELLRDDGYLGAITSRSGFFLTSFEEWRGQLVIPRLQALLDLGLGVMHDAMVEASAYVLRAQPHHGEAVFRRLLDGRKGIINVQGSWRGGIHPAAGRLHAHAWRTCRLLASAVSCRAVRRNSRRLTLCPALMLAKALLRRTTFAILERGGRFLLQGR